MSLCQSETPHHGRREADNHTEHYRSAETFSIQLLVEARLNREFCLGRRGWQSQMLSVPSLARKIRDFRTRKASPMVQIRCSRGFDTKKEAFACPNIPRQSVCSSQIFLIGPWSRSLINGRAVPMAERFCCRLPSDG